MGSTAKTRQVGSSPIGSPQQVDFINQILGATTPQAQEAYGNLLQQYSPDQYQELFNKSFVEPALATYEQQVLPSIYQSYGDANAGSSSALNQALGASAKDLSTAIGSQMANFYQQRQQNQLQGLGMLSGLAGQRVQEPIIQQGYSPLGAGLGAAGQIGGAALPYILSSKEAKENIRDYDGSMDKIRDMEVKIYDYKDEYGGEQDRLGLIAEHLPKEFVAHHGDMLHVDLYALIGVLINGVKELDKRISQLES